MIRVYLKRLVHAAKITHQSKKVKKLTGKPLSLLPPALYLLPSCTSWSGWFVLETLLQFEISQG
jgi:hypothetical protein